MPSLRQGQTVIFGNRTVTGTDDYGNDVYGAVETPVSGCAISPGNSSENWQGTEQIISDVVVHAPLATVIDLPFDYMKIGGVEYNLVGNPRNWVSPFTGTLSLIEIQGRQVTTGGGAT